MINKGHPQAKGLIFLNDYAVDPTARDLSGNDKYGVVVGCPITPSRFGKALSFNGTSQYVDINYNAFYPTGDLSIVAIVTPTVVSTGTVVDNGSYGNGWFLTFNTGKVRVYEYSDAWVYAESTTTFVADTSYHIILTRKDGGYLSVYVNGKLEAQTASSGAITYNQGRPAIGTCYNGSSYNNSSYSGQIHQVRIYNRNLNSAEVQDLYENPRALFKQRKRFYVGSFNIAGNIVEDTTITDWRVVAVDAVTGAYIGTTTSSGTAYEISNIPETHGAVLVCYPKIDRIWTTVTVVALNEFCVPAAPDTTPKLYQATNIGSAPNKTGASEPEWPVSGTVVDGDITWTYIADLIGPLAIGPKLPVFVV